MHTTQTTTPADFHDKFTPEWAETFHGAVTDFAKVSATFDDFQSRCASMWQAIKDTGRDDMARGWITFVAEFFVKSATPETVAVMAAKFAA